MDGMRNFASAWLALVRFEHAIMLAVAVGVGQILALGNLPQNLALLAAAVLVPIFNEFASFAHNDLLDIESDRKNRKLDRPLVSGKISREAAWATVAIGYIASNLIAYSINQTAFAISVIFTVLSVAYNMKLKDMALVGNAYIAASMAVPFYFGAASVLASEPAPETIIWLCELAFAAGLGREIAKTIQDEKGDRNARGSASIAVVLGKKTSAIISAACYFMVLPLSYFIFQAGIRQTVFAVGLVVAADVAFAYLAFGILSKYDNPKFLKFAQKASLGALACGLAGIVLGVI